MLGFSSSGHWLSWLLSAFFERDPLGFFNVTFVWDNYAKFFSSFYYTVSLRPLWSASLGSLVVVLLAFPAMYIIVDLHRRGQLFWVILLLSLMCLSEVIICENVIDDARGEQLVRALSNVIRNNISAIDHALEIQQLRDAIIPGAISLAMEMGKA